MPTGPRTEKLLRWYYLVDERSPPATCTIEVDSGGDPTEVGTFLLADVVDAAKVIYGHCLIDKGQVGLEFPSEGHNFVRLMRLDRVPSRGVGTVGGGMGPGEGELRRVEVPGGKGVFVVSDREPGLGRNVSNFS